MKEYNVSFYATHDGGFLLDLHTSSGTSPYAKFTSVETLKKFFADQGTHEERLAEIDAICSNLKPGHAYHEQMFLPDNVIDAVEKLIAETGGLVDGALPPVHSAVLSGARSL